MPAKHSGCVPRIVSANGGRMFASLDAGINRSVQGWHDPDVKSSCTPKCFYAHGCYCTIESKKHSCIPKEILCPLHATQRRTSELSNSMIDQWGACVWCWVPLKWLHDVSHSDTSSFLFISWPRWSSPLTNSCPLWAPCWMPSCMRCTDKMLCANSDTDPIIF